MNKIPAYEGNGKFVFVSYSHKDSHLVYPIITVLSEMGYNVWYDEGIPLVVDYGGVLFRMIKKCSIFMLFVSENSVASKDVDKEVRNALSMDKPVLRINIDNSPLLDDWAFHIPATNNYISINAEPSEFYEKVCEALTECRGEGSAKTSKIQEEEHKVYVQPPVKQEIKPEVKTIVQNEVKPKAEPKSRSKSSQKTGIAIAISLACLILVAVGAVFLWDKLSNPTGGYFGSDSDDGYIDEVNQGDLEDESTVPEGKNLNIYAWNEEFKGFFEKYYTVPDDITVNWIINKSDGGLYRQKLDEALLNQADASAEDRVDIFLAEHDYLRRYVNSDYTIGIDEVGFENVDTMYQYTIDACTDSNGVCKGIGYQLCPGTLIYRRSIAKTVLGTDDPAEVQAALNTWDKFNSVAAKAKKKGYLMTHSYESTFRAHTGSRSKPWVNSNNELQISGDIKDWIDQSKNFVNKGYSRTNGLYDTYDHTSKKSKTMCFFGPSWYYNWCMGDAHIETNGDWAVCQGPESYFWGGTWLLIANGTDNPQTIKDIFESFTVNEEICTNLVRNDLQFANNRNVMNAFAENASYVSDFLGGQNDIAVLCDVAENIEYGNCTEYDQLLDEGIQTYMADYFSGAVSYDTALGNFYSYVAEIYPHIVIR